MADFLGPAHQGANDGATAATAYDKGALHETARLEQRLGFRAGHGDGLQTERSDAKTGCSTPH